MERIFANPGFKHIADQIISYLDPSSMVNFKQVNQTIAHHFKTYKTCGLFFEKTLKEIESVEKMLEPKFFNPMPEFNVTKKQRKRSNCKKKMYNVFAACQMFGFECRAMKQIACKDFPLEIKSFQWENFESMQTEANKVWQMYRLICQLRCGIIQTEEDLQSYLIPSIGDTYNSFETCPLTLAMESKQDGLVKLMLDNKMLEMCSCKRSQIPKSIMK